MHVFFLDVLAARQRAEADPDSVDEEDADADRGSELGDLFSADCVSGDACPDTEDSFCIACIASDGLDDEFDVGSYTLSGAS